MNLAMSRVLFTIIVSLGLLPLTANAQYGQYYGTGMPMAAQGCQSQMGGGATNKIDGMRELALAWSKAKKEADKDQKDLDAIEKKLDRAKKDISGYVGEDNAQDLYTHIDSQSPCSDYRPGGQDASAGNTPESKLKVNDPAPDTKPTQGSNNAPARSERMPASVDRAPAATVVQPFATLQTIPVAKFLGQSGYPEICDEARNGAVVVQTACVSLHTRVRGDDSETTADDCYGSLKDYMDQSAKKHALKRALKKAQDAEEAAQNDAEDKYNEAQNRQGSTEGGFCMECYLKSNGGGQVSQGPDWGRSIADGITAVVAVGAGLYANNQISKNNAALGYPTGQLFPAWGYGLPYAFDGIYGALGGGSAQGSMGCGSGMYGNVGGMNGGMFGYPNGMMGSPMSGGMYLPGMTPWGMNGPGGMNPMMAGMGGGGYPMGMAMGGMLGMAAGGYMQGGYMMGGAMMGSGYMQGYPGMMMSGGAMMAGGAMMGMMSPGMMSGGGYMMGSMMPGMMMSGGAMMGAMSGGYMMPGMMAGGMMAPGMMAPGMMASGGIGMMAGGMMAPGMMAGSGYMMPGGMMMSGGAMMGAYMGGYPMSTGYMMGSMMGTMVGGGMGMMSSGMMLAGLGSNPQMMQLQMQQYQQQMQAYQQAQQNAMQRQQSSMQLQSEISNLMMRLQMVQSGAMYGTGGTSLLGLGGSSLTGLGTISPLGGINGISTGGTVINTNGTGTITPSTTGR